jgi:DNA-binding beta-propeller fold protein YncE
MLIPLAASIVALALATGSAKAQSAAASPTAGTGVTREAATQYYASVKKDKTLVYVAVPGNGGSLDDGGYGILVFDRDKNWKFVKRIPLWDYPSWLGPGDFRGISAHAGTSRLFVSHHRGVAAFDLRTDKMLWHTDSLNTGNFDDGDCCDSSQVTIDGKTIIAGAMERKDRWWTLDASTGKITGEIATPNTMRPHNVVISPDGSRLYLGANFNGLFSVVDTKTMKVIRTTGPTTGDTKTFTLNGAGTLIYACMTELLGFEVIDIASGKLIERVEVPGFRWEGRRFGHVTPSHGIALSPDEKEVWLVDGVEGQNYLHVFDNTVTPKKLLVSLPTRRPAAWVTFSIDGKYVYNSNGEIFDAVTKKKVHQLIDEFGRPAGSEKTLEVVFEKDKVVKVGERTSRGQVGAPSSQ